MVSQCFQDLKVMLFISLFSLFSFLPVLKDCLHTISCLTAASEPVEAMRLMKRTTNDN